MPKTIIKGVKAQHCEITDQCRMNRTDMGAFDEAASRLRKIYDEMAAAWDIGQGAKFHLVLVVQRPGDE